MYKIIVISDTHMPRKGKSLPQQMLDAMKEANLVLHAGDINKDYVIYELQEIAPVEAVCGNNDDEYICSILGKRKIISAAGKRIGLVHGDGEKGTTLGRVKKAFEAEDLDCVVFGHSHIPFNEIIEGVLYFNPGSPTDKRREESFSYGILTIEDGNINSEIVYFN